jgi:hypothetical protein
VNCEDTKVGTTMNQKLACLNKAPFHQPSSMDILFLKSFVFGKNLRGLATLYGLAHKFSGQW